MASLGSSIRSAARATSSAYKRLPIRWRLAGGSAALTLVILCGFAVIVGVLTTRQIHEDFRTDVARSADKLEEEAQLRIVARSAGLELRPVPASPDLNDFAASENAAIRVITKDVDDARAIVHVWPEDRAQENLRPLRLQFTKHLLEVIASMSVEHHQLRNAYTCQ